MPEFYQPAWLWLLLAAPLPLLLRPRGGASVKRIACGLLRGLALGALVIALAGPLAGSYSRYTDVVFALDLSHSVGRDSVAEAIRFINQAWANKQPEARMGLVVFGADAAVEALVRRDPEPIQQKCSPYR